MHLRRAYQALNAKLQIHPSALSQTQPKLQYALTRTLYQCVALRGVCVCLPATKPNSFVCRRCRTYSLSAKPIAAVGLVLNATTACQEVTSVFNTTGITVILSQNLYPNFVLVNKHHPYFFHERKRYLLTDCKRLYSSTTFKIFDSQNCKQRMLLRIAKFRSIPKKCQLLRLTGVINSVKFNRSYDDLYLGVTFWNTTSGSASRLFTIGAVCSDLGFFSGIWKRKSSHRVCGVGASPVEDLVTKFS